MGCCGEKRAAYKKNTKRFGTPQNGNLPKATINSKPKVKFQFNGDSSKIYYGAITGRRYIYKKRGDTLLVDSKDVPGMMGEPMVQRDFSDKK